MDELKKKRGRPKGSKNRRAPTHGLTSAALPVDPSSPSASAPATTQRAALEADRERLLERIKANAGNQCATCMHGGDPKVEATLQTALNAVNRMLLQIAGETAPSDANLVRSPQWARLKAKLFDALSKKHPEAWADVLAIETEG